CLPEPLPLGRLYEEVEDVWQVLAVHDVLEPDEAELRLAAARRVRDHADRAGGGHGGHVGVPHPLAARLMAGARPGGVHAALLGHAPGLAVADLGDALHDRLAHLDAGLRDVLYAPLEEHAGEPHHAQAELTAVHGAIL